MAAVKQESRNVESYEQLLTQSRVKLNNLQKFQIDTTSGQKYYRHPHPYGNHYKSFSGHSSGQSSVSGHGKSKSGPMSVSSLLNDSEETFIASGTISPSGYGSRSLPQSPLPRSQPQSPLANQRAPWDEFSCSHCPSVFITMQALKSHEYIHTGNTNN